MGYIELMYSKTTRGITVTVKPYFLDEQSSPQENHYVWAYQVNIKNSSNSTMKLSLKIFRIFILSITYNLTSINCRILPVGITVLDPPSPNSPSLPKLKSLINT